MPADFNLGDGGVAIILRPKKLDDQGNLVPDPIPTGSTNIKIVLVGEVSNTRYVVTAESQNNGFEAWYNTTGTDFSTADTYNGQLVYTRPDGTSTSSVDPDTRIVIRARL